MLLTGVSPCCYHKHHNPKQVVSTLTFKMDRRLKLKVFEGGLLLRHLNGYILVCFLKPGTPLRLPARLNGRLILAFKTHGI